MGFDKWNFDRVRRGMTVRFTCDHFEWSNWASITIEITHELTPNVIVPSLFTITTSEPQTMSVVIESEDVPLLGMYHITIKLRNPIPQEYSSVTFRWVAFEIVKYNDLTLCNDNSFCKCEPYFKS